MKNEYKLSKKALIIISLAWFSILSIGLVLILYFNEAFYITNPIIWSIFFMITYLGDAIVLIVIMGILYISYDKKYALHLVYCVLASFYINSFIKGLLKDPRPPTNDLRLEKDYGFPSAHSQVSVAAYGYLAFEFKDSKFKNSNIIPILFSLVIFLVAISRVIIGVHDVQDVVGGLLIGIIFLLVVIYLEPYISKKIGLLNLPIKIMLSIVISGLLFLVGIVFFPKAGEGLIVNAIPYSDSGGFALVSGAFLGISIGYLLENEYIQYDPTQLTKKEKRTNLLIELIILIPLYLLLEWFLDFNILTRFIRYAIFAFVLVFIGPLIFKKINSK